MSTPTIAHDAEPAVAIDESDVREAQVKDLGMAFRRVFRSLSRLRGRDTHLAGGELSHAQFELLIELHERGALSAGELAAAARLSPGTVTQMLDHLADCGHVERVRSQTDRRVVVSRLTEQGRAKIEAKHAAWKSRWDEALSGLEIEELRAATRVLERLGVMVEDAPAQVDCEASEQAPGGPAQAAQN
ncbi:MAG: MarR family winged helix-turn-helix transcriptional regulator [Solirubrobacteraceae bacterium]